ncbi:hypothetical protein [Acinetobacter larvae]|uniref:Uncharacterized protein n=1 Tax=Acinetobacter larvae TaxID=1789224 RepID=A0A1B2LZA8_9GAMM|nr:hypothetical protein [Acinetobacter larvae]AOA58292.1 hypothetical protein BFG52_07920 [Acinetobacter larvae]
MKISRTLRPDNREKEPVKILVKTRYRIYIILNNNFIITGTHAGMLLISPKGYELYDPNGNFHYEGIAEGTMRVFPVDITDHKTQKDIFKKYLDFQHVEGEDVYIYTFHVSKNEFDEVQKRIYDQVRCGGSFSCTKCVSNAVAGIGVFKSIDQDVFLPSSLKRQLDKISTPIRIARNTNE